MIFDSQNRRFRRTHGHRLLKALKPCVERPPLVAPTDFQGQSSLGASSRWRRGRSECGREDRRLEPAPTMDPAGRTRGSAHVGGSSCSRPGRSRRYREDRRLEPAPTWDHRPGRSRRYREDRRLEPAPTRAPAGRTRGSAHVGGSSCSRPGRSPRYRENRRLEPAPTWDLRPRRIPRFREVRRLAGWCRRQRDVDR